MDVVVGTALQAVRVTYRPSGGPFGREFGGQFGRNGKKFPMCFSWHLTAILSQRDPL